MIGGGGGRGGNALSSTQGHIRTKRGRIEEQKKRGRQKEGV